MATYEAATWSELATLAATKTFGTNDIIKITADIDCNSEIPEGVPSTLEFQYASGVGTACTVTLDGSYEENGTTKSRTIRNLRTNISSPVEIFLCENIILKNLDFKNLIIDKNLCRGKRGGSTCNLIKCRFVGKRSEYLVGQTGSENNMTFTSCAFNMQFVGSNKVYIPLNGAGSGHYATAKFCRFKETYGGWDVSQGYDTSTKFMRLIGCYISGEIVGDSSIVITDNYSYDSVIQNVLDAELKTKAASGTTISVSAPKGVWKNLILPFDGSSTTPYTYTNVSSTLAIPESPSDMTDTTKLYNDGFDVVH